MIVKVGKKEWDVKDCTYAERRELHKLNAKVWWDGKMDVEAYYEVLEKVGAIAGLGEMILKIWICRKLMKFYKRSFQNILVLNQQKKIQGVEPCGLVFAIWHTRTS